MVGLDPNIDVARLDSLPLGSWNGDKERRDSQDQYRSEEHTSELQSRLHLVCRLLLEKKKQRLELHPLFCLPHLLLPSGISPPINTHVPITALAPSRTSVQLTPMPRLSHHPLSLHSVT